MMSDIGRCLAGYKTSAVKQVEEVLKKYKGLSLSLSPYAFSDGSKDNLASLTGTIPITWGGKVYNIPVCIRLLKSFPDNPPICFVMPTNDMEVKVSIHVAYNGRIYLPELHEWSTSKSTILNLIQVMISTFSQHPPVFKKNKTRKETTTPYPQQSYIPMPGSYNMYGGMSGSYPQMPSLAMPTPEPYSLASNTEMPSYPPYSMLYSTQPTTPTPPTLASCSPDTNTISDEHIKASLLSGIEHKMKRKLEDISQQKRAELQILQQTAEELNQGKEKIKSIIDKLQKEKTELEWNISRLQEKDVELEKSIAKLSEEDEIDVDEAVITTAPLYKQILNAYAEEAATEDAIYYMGEALRRGVIDVEVFLKQVRSLSRKQFMLRAIMYKCRSKAGLSA